MAEQRAEGGREPGLDGVRALAVAAVLVFHVRADWLPGGFLGVDVFFVLSGYLITALLLAERRSTERIRLLRFSSRRARRLLPELLLVLLVTAAVAALIGNEAAAGLRGGELAALGFYGNWWRIQLRSGYFAPFGPPPMLQHLWSLGIEEQFYLLWPPVLAVVPLVCRRFRPGGQARSARATAFAAGLVAAAGAASFGLMAAWSRAGVDPSRLYFGSDTHAGPLLLGAATGLLLPPARVHALARTPRRVLAALGAAGLTVLAVLARLLQGTEAGAYQGGIAAAAVAAALLCPAAIAAGPLRAVLGAPALVWLGRRSYGLYLWHWPLIATLGYLGLDADGAPLVVGAELLLPLALAALSYRLVQQPVVRRGWRGALAHARERHRAQRRRLPRITHIAAVAATLLPLLAVHTLVTAPDGTALQAQLQAGRTASARSGGAPAAGSAAGYGGRVPGSAITAIGDSVLLAAAPALQQARPGVDIEAVVGRQMDTAPGLLRQLAEEGGLRPVVVVALGTNGTVAPSTLDRIAELTGPGRTLALVTVHVPRPWQNQVNTALARFARTHPGTVLVPWNAAATGHPDALYPDRTHPRSEGAPLYATTLLTALDRAAG
ncbi:acyltransferase family protein [Streptacidiphilus sp. N1-12]|uniref:Acyltransferase family protein n=2 Tax=Streptacidiphilus alkalitolerans TaxID=3342712 RepID=A0ABV6VMN1_9ACTN